MSKSIFTTFLMAAFVGLATFVMPIDTNAQVGILRNQNRYSKADVSRIIAKLETSSNVFRRDFDRAMDNSSLNGTSAEDRYNDNVRDYENALDRLRSQFDRNDSWWETRNDVSNVIREAQTVNTMMNTISFRRTLENRWNTMRNDLNTLADTYDLPGLNGGGWTGGIGGGVGGGWGGTGQTSSPPSWAQGTFYGTAPDGGQIVLSLTPNGHATANVGGIATYGTYYRSLLRLGSNTARLRQTSNGFQTISTLNGETINYNRSGWAGGVGGGWGGTGQTSTPPSWAQGTFYGTAPNGTQITLTLARNGQATSNAGGALNYGTYYRGLLRFGNDSARVNRINNGIQTVSTLNGETINYNKSGWTGGDGGYGGGNPPNWAVGSFRARNPISGGWIYMTVANNGAVTVTMDGNPSYGTLNGSLLTMGVNTATVYRQGNGFRTVSTGDGQTIVYTRN